VDEIKEMLHGGPIRNKNGIEIQYHWKRELSTALELSLDYKVRKFLAMPH
jgi:hypothetical protein